MFNWIESFNGYIIHSIDKHTKTRRRSQSSGFILRNLCLEIDVCVRIAAVFINQKLKREKRRTR